MDDLATATSWRGWPESIARLQRQLVEPLVGEPQCTLTAGDLDLQFRAVAAAAPAELFKTLAGVGESFLRAGALLFDLALSLREQSGVCLFRRVCEREWLGG